MKIGFIISGILLLICAFFNNIRNEALASIFAGLWIFETIGTVAYGSAHYFQRSRENSKPTPAAKLRTLPVPTDAHEILECFCELMNALDSAMPYCSYEGEAMLLGGGSDETGYAYFRYTKDWPLQKIYEDLGFDVPISHELDKMGWSIGGHEDDWINLSSKNVSGYSEWIGYDSLKKIGISDSEIARQWEAAVRATINNDWPRATITRCTVSCSDGTFSYQVNIKT